MTLGTEQITAIAINHLWQSTVFGLGAALLTVPLRRNSARARFWLWWLASVKFLVPFSLLMVAGAALQLHSREKAQMPAFALTVDSLAQPFSTDRMPAPAHLSIALSQAPHPIVHAAYVTPPWVAIAFAIWLLGVLLLLTRWLRSWAQVRAAVRASASFPAVGGIPVRCSRTQLEPGVFGIFRPVLLLPEGLADRLSAPQMEAIFAHELCHVRRRDNLLASVHMLVQALFWFHPFVWWSGARLIEERERACDEAVLASSAQPLALAETYAESILSVCKFYSEAPLPCVSGITGSDLKQRIVRIMNGGTTVRLNLPRRVLLCTAAAMALGLPVGFGLLHARVVHAQQPATQDKGIQGTWQGTLHAGQDLRLQLKITRTPASALSATFYSIDQGGQAIPVNATTFQGDALVCKIDLLDGSFQGKLSADGKTLTGTWSQGGGAPLPLSLERVNEETAWEIPKPTPATQPMDPAAHPSFDVVTIKPNDSGHPGHGFTLRGDHILTINTSVVDMLCFAYGISNKQIVGGPEWMGTEKFDIDGKADIAGLPSIKQSGGMLQKLLAERFQIKFHRETRELSAYVLTVAPGGPKLQKSPDGLDAIPGLGFSQLGNLHVHDATLEEFAGVMQTSVFERPVVDQTGVEGRYTFNLKWTADETQFASVGVKVPPPSEAADAAPPLFTAIQEQIGLKLTAGKPQVPVLVIDHVQQPSAN